MPSTVSGPASATQMVRLDLVDGPPSAPGLLFAGFHSLDSPLPAGVLVPATDFQLAVTTDAQGSWSLSTPWPGALQPFPVLYLQSWHLGPGGGLTSSNGLAFLSQ